MATNPIHNTNINTVLSKITLNDTVNTIQPMQKGKAAGWGMTYEWVSLPIMEGEPDKTDDAVMWCLERFGRQGVRWFVKKKQFYFKDEKDLTMFILRFV